jgi:hypothetical protein
MQQEIMKYIQGPIVMMHLDERSGKRYRNELVPTGLPVRSTEL